MTSISGLSRIWTVETITSPKTIYYNILLHNIPSQGPAPTQISWMANGQLSQSSQMLSPLASFRAAGVCLPLSDHTALWAFWYCMKETAFGLHSKDAVTSAFSRFPVWQTSELNCCNIQHIFIQINIENIFNAILKGLEHSGKGKSD